MNTSSESLETKERSWSYIDSIVIYRSSAVKGTISANFSISVNISLVTDRGILPLFVKNLTKAVTLDTEETISEILNLDIPTGGLLTIIVQNIQQGSFKVGDYYIRIDVLNNPKELFSILLPYILIGIILLVFSSIQGRATLNDYLVRNWDVEYSEIAFTIFLSLIFFNPRSKVFPGEPSEIIGGIAGYSYAITWWIYLAVSISLHFTLNKRSVQYLWSYPSGKQKIYHLRIVQLVKSVWSVSFQIFFYYFSVIYFDLSGREVTIKRIFQVVEIIVTDALIGVQYVIVLGLIFLMLRRVEVRPALVLILYYIIDYLKVIPIRLSNLGNFDFIWWMLLPLTSTISYKALEKLYLSAEVIS